MSYVRGNSLKLSTKLSHVKLLLLLPPKTLQFHVVEPMLASYWILIVILKRKLDSKEKGHKKLQIDIERS